MTGLPEMREFEPFLNRFNETETLRLDGKITIHAFLRMDMTLLLNCFLRTGQIEEFIHLELQTSPSHFFGTRF
jgi:hypothetical protein